MLLLLLLCEQPALFSFYLFLFFYFRLLGGCDSCSVRVYLICRFVVAGWVSFDCLRLSVAVLTAKGPAWTDYFFSLCLFVVQRH